MLVHPLWKMTWPARSRVVVRLPSNHAIAGVRICAAGVSRPVRLPLSGAGISLRASRITRRSLWSTGCWIARIAPTSWITLRRQLPPLLRLPVLLLLPESGIIALAVLVSPVFITLSTVISVPILAVSNSAVLQTAITLIPGLCLVSCGRTSALAALPQRKPRRQRQHEHRGQRHRTRFPRIGKAGHRFHSRLGAARMRVSYCYRSCRWCWKALQADRAVGRCFPSSASRAQPPSDGPAQSHDPSSSNPDTLPLPAAAR